MEPTVKVAILNSDYFYMLKSQGWRVMFVDGVNVWMTNQ